MNKRRVILFLVIAGLLLSYISGPVLAATFRIGEHLGPVVYPESLHSTLYIAAYETKHNEKPGIRFDSWIYHRPLLYGLSRRLKSEQQRQTYIEMARRNDSQRLES
jgi:hypothetical protein